MKKLEIKEADGMTYYGKKEKIGWFEIIGLMVAVAMWLWVINEVVKLVVG